MREIRSNTIRYTYSQVLLQNTRGSICFLLLQQYGNVEISNRIQMSFYFVVPQSLSKCYKLQNNIGVKQKTTQKFKRTITNKLNNEVFCLPSTCKSIMLYTSI